MTHSRSIRWVSPVLLLVLATRCLAGDEVGPLVCSLWLVQRFGTAEAVAPRNDQHVKGKLSKRRHTFATRSILSGTDVTILQKILGHSEIGMTMRYVKIAEHYK